MGTGFTPYSKALLTMLVTSKYPEGPVGVAGPEGLRDHLLPASGDKSPWLHHCLHWDMSVGLKDAGASLGVPIHPAQGTELRRSWPYSHPGHTAAFLLMGTRVTELNGGWCTPSSELKIYNTWPGQTSETGTLRQLSSVQSSRFLQVALTVLHFIKISHLPVIYIVARI